LVDAAHLANWERPADVNRLPPITWPDDDPRHHRRVEPTLGSCVVIGDDEEVKRVSVVGNTGSGKSSLATRIAELLGVTLIELDAIHHLPGWTPIDPDEFRARITSATSAESWVIDGNYRTVVVDGPVWQRADTVVWLDLPRRTVMRQVTMRTVRRLIRREELWNGNREPFRNLWSWEPERSIIRWAWTQHAKYQERYSAAMASAALDHITFVRLRSRAEAERWLTTLPARSHRT
jgi:adenylate kinase family enzyme